MALTIYHNPRCSKSRQTLEIINNAGIEPVIVHYLENTPNAETIQGLAEMLGLAVADLLRKGESVFKEADNIPDLDDGAALAMWIAAHPIVLERPIVVDTEAGQAVVGRPPENVHKLLSR